MRNKTKNNDYETINGEFKGQVANVIGSYFDISAKTIEWLKSQLKSTCFDHPNIKMGFQIRLEQSERMNHVGVVYDGLNNNCYYAGVGQSLQLINEITVYSDIKNLFPNGTSFDHDDRLIEDICKIDVCISGSYNSTSKKELYEVKLSMEPVPAYNATPFSGFRCPLTFVIPRVESFESISAYIIGKAKMLFIEPIDEIFAGQIDDFMRENREAVSDDAERLEKMEKIRQALKEKNIDFSHLMDTKTKKK